MFLKKRKFLAMREALKQRDEHLALAQSLIDERTAFLKAYAAEARSLLGKELSFREAIRNQGIL